MRARVCVCLRVGSSLHICEHCVSQGRRSHSSVPAPLYSSKMCSTVVPYQSSGRNGADVALEVDDECNDMSDLSVTPPPAAAVDDDDADASTAMQQRQTSKTTISIPGGGGIHSTLELFPSILQYSSSTVLSTEKGHSISCRLHTQARIPKHNQLNHCNTNRKHVQDRQAGRQSGRQQFNHGMP